MTEAAAWTDGLAPEEERPRSAPAPRQPPRKLDGSREENYIKSAVYRETERVRTVGEGGRNDALNIAAMALGQLVAGGVLDEAVAVRELTDAALTAGLGKVETKKTIASGMKKGAEDPRGVPPASSPQRATYDDDYVYDELDRFDETPPTSEDENGTDETPPKRERAPLSPSDVLSQWREAGPLIHEPTGIKQLDEWTGGGFVYGSRVYVPGAPDAGKTLWLVQLAHVWLERGVVVGLLAVDEEPGDIVTRIAQRVGYARHHCETRDPRVMAEMLERLGQLPLRLYDDTWTIESAAADLAKHASGARAALLIDSVQTVTCDKESASALAGHEMSEVSAVTARVRAIRAMATKHKLIAVATSELGRGAYRSSDPTLQTSTMAGSKWSGAIEYSARILIGLRSVPGETDLVELEVAKNKHGPRDLKMHLRIDRRAQTLSETVYEPEPETAPGERRSASMKATCVADAVLVLKALEDQPGLGVRQLRSAMAVAAGMGSTRVDAALAALGDAVVRQPGPNKSQLMSINRNKLPEATRRAVESLK